VALNLCEGEAEAGLQLPANLCDQRDQMLSSTTAIKVRERKRRARSDRPILFLNGTMALCSLGSLGYREQNSSDGARRWICLPAVRSPVSLVLLATPSAADSQIRGSLGSSATRRHERVISCRVQRDGRREAVEGDARRRVPRDDIFTRTAICVRPRKSARHLSPINLTIKRPPYARGFPFSSVPHDSPLNHLAHKSRRYTLRRPAIKNE